MNIYNIKSLLWKIRKLPFSLSVISIHVFLLLPVSLYSQQDSLMFYLELAAKNNPTVLQRFSEYQAALQKIPQVGSLPDPELTVGVFVTPMELVMGKQVADFKLMQMFPWFGTLKYAKDEMSLMAKAKYELFREAKFEVYFDVQSTYYNLYKLNQELEISKKNLEILRTIDRLAIIRYRTSASIQGGASNSPVNSTQNQSQKNAGSTGMNNMSGTQNAGSSNTAGSSSMAGSPMGNTGSGSGLADLYRIQIEIGNLENNIALLKDQQNSIKAKFNTFLNRPLVTMVSISDTLMPDTLNINLKEVTDSILKNNPMLGMSRYEQQSLEARKKMVSRMGYPMVGLGIDYSLINKSEMVTSPDNGMDMIMPMVSVTIPIYRRKYKAMQAEADILKASAEHNYEATANDLQAEYFQALQSYQDARRRIKLYSDQDLLANKSLNIMLKSFSSGGTSLTDIMLVRQQTLDYELKQIEAVTDFNTAIAWLKRLMAYPNFTK